ncbi:reticulon-3-like [Scyliorhinus canicula]|uniref:reticulon-3-like n=1 Tax=Scyliorhinus canicula TaxID=7830 RepID=UPI0018F70B49|nr:reticulon-3-like [Scyliorhinus canicula]
MTEEWQPPLVSTSVRLDDIVQSSSQEDVEKEDDLIPLKPAAGDAPIFSVPGPAAPSAFEPARNTDIGDDGFVTPPPLPARSRPEPDSSSDSAAVAATGSVKTRPESIDESFLSPSVAPECMMQTSADFSVNLKDQPASAEPVGPQDAAPVHVEPVPVFSMPSFSSDSVPELTMSAKAVHSDDLKQTEVPVYTGLQTTFGFMENAMDKKVADHLEKAPAVDEKAHVKSAFIESSELVRLNPVDGSPFQYQIGQRVEPNGSEFKGTTSSLVEEPIPEQVNADKGKLKIREVMGMDKVQLSDDREVAMEPHLGLTCEYVGAPGLSMLPLDRIVEEKEFMQNTLYFNEQSVKPADSGLNFCYGDILEVKERNELKFSGPAINQAAVIDTDTSKSINNVTDKSESGAFQDQAASKTRCENEEPIVAKATGKPGYADLEDFVEQSFEQDEKLPLTAEAYFAVSQVPVVSESQTCMTYATFDSYSMLESDYFNTNETVPEHDAVVKGKTEFKETAIPLQLTATKSEVTNKVEDPETKPVTLEFIGNEPNSKVDVIPTSEMNSQLFSNFAIQPNQIMKADYLSEITTSDQTVQSFAPYHLQRTSEIKSPGLETTEEAIDVEIRSSPNPFKPLPSTSEKCVLDYSEEAQNLTDILVKASTHTENVCVASLADPEHAVTQFDAQYAGKEQIALHEPLSFTECAANNIPEVTNAHHLFEEQNTVRNRGVSEDTVIISEERNLPEHVLVDSIIDSADKSDDMSVQFGYREPNISENINQFVDQSNKQELLSSKMVEEKNYSTLHSPIHNISADNSVTTKSPDVTICKEIVISKSEPVLGVQGAATIQIKPVERILADYKHVEQCSLGPPSLEDEIETPSLNVTDVLSNPLLMEKGAIEISLSHLEAVMPSAIMSERHPAKESITVLSMNRDTTSTTLSMPNEEFSIVDRGLGLKALSEETSLTTSQSVTWAVAPSLQDKFPYNCLEEFGEMKAKINDHTEKLKIAEVQMKPQELATDASLSMNEEVTKASKEVVTKILETSVALAEVLGEKERALKTSMPRQETDVTFPFPVGEGDISKKYVSVETMVPELPLVPESTETSRDAAVADTADISVKPDKKSVVDLIYWRDIKKTGLVFGASLFLLLSMTIFSIVSVIAYLALALLSVTISFRIYRGILQAVQKSDDGHPFKACLETDVAVSNELVHKYSDTGLGHINRVITELRRLFLVEDLVDSLKFSVLMWLLTYVGALFNGLTLLIMALVAVFSIPVVYERHQAQIDHYIGIVSKQIRDVTAKIQTKVPGLKRKTE